MTSSAKRDRRQVNFWDSIYFRLGVFFLLIATATLFFGKINSVSVKGYAVKELEDKNRTLQREYQRLELEIARASSMGALAERVGKLGFVDADEIEFVKSVDTAVAQR